MSLFDDNRKVQGAAEKKCDGCVCEILKKLYPGVEVEKIIVKGETIEDLVFINFDQSNCCVYFVEEARGNEQNVLILDCRKIDAIFLEAD